MTNFPRFPALRGRKGFWLRQVSDLPHGSNSLAEALVGIKSLGGDCLCLKVADGLTWQGRIDPPTHIVSVDDLAAVRDACALVGVALLPVVVPRGVRGEAEFHGAIAQVCGCLMTDTEPYAGFWDQASTDLIPVYAQYLRAAAGDAYLVNQPDPRYAGYTDGHVAATTRYYDAIAAQHYVGWAAIGWTDVAAEVASFGRMAALGLDTYATLYGAERTDLAVAFWKQVAGQAQGVDVFSLALPDLAAFTDLTPAVAEPVAIPGTGPVPDPDPSPAPVVVGLTADDLNIALQRRMAYRRTAAPTLRGIAQGLIQVASILETADDPDLARVPSVPQQEPTNSIMEAATRSL